MSVRVPSYPCYVTPYLTLCIIIGFIYKINDCYEIKVHTTERQISIERPLLYHLNLKRFVEVSYYTNMYFVYCIMKNMQKDGLEFGLTIPQGWRGGDLPFRGGK